MISIDVTLLIQMANFFVFLVLMNFVLYRPIRRILTQRQQFVDEQQNKIDSANGEVTAALELFNAKIQEARAQGRQTIQDMKADAYEQEKALLVKATDESSAVLQQMRKKVQTDIAGARKQLKTQVKAFSQDLAQKILGRSI